MLSPSDSLVDDAEFIKTESAYSVGGYDQCVSVNQCWIKAAERIANFVLACRDAKKFSEDLMRAFDVPHEDLVD